MNIIYKTNMQIGNKHYLIIYSKTLIMIEKNNTNLKNSYSKINHKTLQRAYGKQKN